jgi:hypothetical protein
LPTSLVHVRLKQLSDGHCFMVDFYPFIRLIVHSQVCNNQFIWEFAPERYPNVSLCILKYPTLSVIARSFGISF